MGFLERILHQPSYGYSRNGQFYIPSRQELWREVIQGLNVFGTRGSAKNWLPLFNWTNNLLLLVPFAIFIVYYFSWSLMLVGAAYSMVLMGSHGTLWYHRYCTHRAFRFRSRFIRDICRNLVVKTVTEEGYAVSHLVHHHLSEKPGDPYNVNGGWLYCFFADIIHQPIHRHLSEKDYGQLCKLMNHTGLRLNSYAQYQRWGSLAHPASAIAHYLLNWAVWYGIFYFVGGHALATALFGWAGIWVIGLRTFNFDGHGAGKDKRREGFDFDQGDRSINQWWPGYVAGEWHNNHHLYPYSARSGFLRYQIDLPWYFIRSLAAVGWVADVRDARSEFVHQHYQPWLQRKAQHAQTTQLETSRP